MDTKEAIPTPQVAQRQGVSNLVDRISALPDELLVDIVSRLWWMNEIGATSILSRRRRYIWAYSPTLNLHDYMPFWETGRYIKLVDSVVEQHRASRVKFFKVYLDLDDDRYTSSYFKWIQFAEKTRVQELQLVLFGDAHYGDISFFSFDSSLQCLHPQGPLETQLKHQCTGFTNFFPKYIHPCAYSGLKSSLRAVQLVSLQMTGEGVECLLSNCPVLERITVVHCGPLGNLKVVGPSIALKYLTIEGCDLENIETCDATSLVSYNYDGLEINLHLWNVPSLVEVSIQYPFYIRVPKTVSFSQLSCCLSQLEVLKLKTPLLQCRLLKPPEKKMKQAAKCVHHSLRVMEVEGFRGRTRDIELIMYVIENAVDLEKLVIHPLEPWCFSWKNAQEIKHAMKQLKEKVPSNVQLLCHPVQELWA